MSQPSARGLLSSEASSPDDALSWLTHTIRATLNGVDGVSISLARGRRLVSVGATDPLVRAADARQYERGEGPVSAAQFGVPISQDDDVADTPPSYTCRRQSNGLGLRSLTSIPLASRGRLAGVLNLYSAQPGPLAADVLDAAVAMAEVAGDLVALNADVDVVAQVMTAGDEIAEGTRAIMRRFGMDAERALAYLVRASQTSQLCLRQVATEVTGGRVLVEP